MSIADSRPAVDVIERSYTAADVSAMPAELPSGPVLYELDNGRLITMAPPGNEHGAVEANLTTILHNAAAQRHGKVRCGEVGILLWRNPDRVVGADVAFIASASLPIRESPEGYLETMPVIVVEVLSKNDTASYVNRKIADYLTSGVKQVWIAAPKTRTLTVHVSDLSPRTFTEAESLSLNEIIPDFALSIADVFAD